MPIPYESPEISDRIVAFDSQTLKRQPVAKADLIREFQEINNSRAVRIVATLAAAANGLLDDAAMDRLLMTVHCEMHRMSEEFQHGRRMAQILNPLLEVISKL